MTLKARLQQLERLIRPGETSVTDKVTQVRKADENADPNGPEEIEVPYMRTTIFDKDGAPIVRVFIPENGRDDHLTSQNNIGGQAVS